jgi:serine/threonine-protein kinase
MPDEDAEAGTGIATVAERPAAKGEATLAVEQPLPPSPEATGTIVDKLERSKRPTPDLDQVARARRPTPDLDAPAREPIKRLPTPVTVIDRPELANLTLTTAHDALHDEEIDRTRLFIRLGWALSVAAIGIVPLLPSPLYMQITMVAAMLFGIAVSLPYHQRFADPHKYTATALYRLALVSILNSHAAVLYFGVFTMCPVVVVVGLHFLGRSEAVRESLKILTFACFNYAAIAGLVVSGIIEDPGVFATVRPLEPATQAIGAVFVLATYLLAYVTGRVFREASLVAIDELARATRVASQREALMAELRADLERALRIGGPGRYSEQMVGAFKLGVVLGRGAMGEVYEAVHAKTGEPAAVKLLRRELLQDATTVARFLREARVSGALASPYVVRVLDASGDDAALPYLAMERLHGVTLAELLRRDSKLPASVVMELARQAGAGIDAAATAGIVHRDLKPQNLMLTDGGPWKILDFGVATLAEEASNLTQGGVVGTPSYMAPEQAQGKRVDGRADVYSLAAVAYRCLTGRHPFSGSDTPALLYAVVHRMPLRPSTLAELPADVDACLAIALAKNPDDRFASGAAFAAALESVFSGSFDPALRRRATALLRRLPWEEPA